MDEDEEASHKDISDADSEGEGGIEDDHEDNVTKVCSVIMTCDQHAGIVNRRWKTWYRISSLLLGFVGLPPFRSLLYTNRHI